MTKRAMCLLFEWIKKNKLLWIVKICNVPHDEAVLECPINMKTIVRDVLEKCMIEGGNYYLSNLTIKADGNWGSSWEEAKH